MEGGGDSGQGFPCLQWGCGLGLGLGAGAVQALGEWLCAVRCALINGLADHCTVQCARSLSNHINSIGGRGEGRVHSIGHTVRIDA